MKRMKKNLIVVLVVLSVLFVGSICAYFTDTESAVNVFTVGNVDIELTEPNFNEDEAYGLYAGQTVKKDPTITNVGINDAYVYIELYIPKAEVETAQEDGTKNPAALIELFTYTIDSNWTQIHKGQNDDNTYNVYVYTYNDRLTQRESTTPIFSEVTLVNLVNPDIPRDFSTYAARPHTTILVNAYAIQADGTGTAAEAWTKYVNQNS